LYERDDLTSARKYQNQLKYVLDNLPKNSLAILRAEGLALLHELRGETSIAIKHRKREIKLMERLHASVQKSIQAGDYDAAMGASILWHWNHAALKARQGILRDLQEQENSQRNGTSQRKCKAAN
jgi:hypothetical protein